MTRLLIFDFDDTLVNNHYLDIKSFEIPYKIVSLNPPSKYEIKKLRRKGKTADYIIKKNLKEKNLKKFYNNIINEREKFFSNDQTNYLILQNHLKKNLKEIKTKNIELNIITTNKNKNLFLKFLKQKKIIKYFSKIIFKDDLNIKLDNSDAGNRILIKRSLLYSILKKSRIKKNEILYIGNSLEDFKACKNLQINFIHFQNDYLPKLVNNEIITINSMSKLKNAIKVMM